MNQSSDRPPQIIARGFDDEPCVLYALEIQTNKLYVNVSREFPPPSYLGWPITHAFDYDIDDFQRLWETYNEGHREALTALYDQLNRQPKQFIDVLNSPP